MTAPAGARVALVGFTGTGKTTIATCLLQELHRRGQPAQVVKLAAPLYRIQRAYYAEAGVHLAPGQQDQELLVEIAARLRSITPHALLNQLLATLADTPPGTSIINDDLRVADPDGAGLSAAGFCLIRLECPDHIRRIRVAERGDQSVIDEPTIFGPVMSQIPTELTLDTHTTTPTQTVQRILAHLHRRGSLALEVMHDA